MKHSVRYTLLTLAMATSAVAQADCKNIDVKNVWSRATPAVAKVAAVYLDLTNTTGHTITLTGGSTPVAQAVELHLHEMKNGMIGMHHLHKLKVDNGQKVVFQPGKYHVMLIGLKHPLKAEEVFPLSLQCADGSQRKFKVLVHEMMQ